jgi:hypothetical protein
MGKANDYKPGDSIYVYFGDKFRKNLRKSYRDSEIYFVEYKILEINDNTLTLVHGERLCDKKHPIGGYGLAVTNSCKFIFTDSEFDELRHASDDELESFCNSSKIHYKAFKKVFAPFRIKEKDNQQ